MTNSKKREVWISCTPRCSTETITYCDATQTYLCSRCGLRFALEMGRKQHDLSDRLDVIEKKIDMLMCLLLEEDMDFD